MKKITIELNTKSINEARKYLLNLKKQIPKMQQEFLMAVAKWVVEEANGYIDRADLGGLVKDQIKGGWEYEPTANGVKIVNRTQKAVFVEFGVGVVGQSKAHPNATQEGYEYNLDSYHKDRKGTGTWVFKSSLENLDIPQNRGDFIKDEGEYVVITRGTQGVWYAYNAIVDAQMELAKSGGGEIGKMWEDIKARYIK